MRAQMNAQRKERRNGFHPQAIQVLEVVMEEAPKAAEERQTVPAQAPSLPLPATSTRILIAEDDGEMRFLLAWALRRQGYAVTECSDGFRMLDKLSFFLHPEEDGLEQIDLIISDIRMPGVSGLSIVKGLRDCEGFPPVILITAFGSEETHAAAREMGVAAMFDKPFDLEDLLTVVRRILPQSPLPH